MSEQHLSTTLDQALARLEAGEPVNAILADDASGKTELAALLLAARELSSSRAVPLPPEPEPGLTAFLEQARALRGEGASWRRGRRVLAERIAALRDLCRYPQTRLVVSVLVALVLLFVSMGSTIALADSSLPGDWLYPFKLAGEELRLSFTFDPAARAQYRLAQAAARAEEVLGLARADLPIDEAALSRLDRSLEASLLSTASADTRETPQLLANIEGMAIEMMLWLATAQATATGDNPLQFEMLERAYVSLAQTLWLAHDGRADLYSFRLDARLGAVKIKAP